MPNPESAELDAVFRALSDPTRRQIFELLGRRPGLTTSELANSTRGMSRWGVMKHLASLRDARLIQTLPDGRLRRHYREVGPVSRAKEWLDEA